ncbi:P-loop NTPase fold protein [Lactococcus petauri]|uniref:KAP family P-loop NTPase fold protein n=1 Tax=Lactococcus petauri TaxID=1940789 RepID=UPI0032E37E41
MSYSQDYIINLITSEDSLGRNKYLDNTMVFFHNLPNRNLVVNLDGRWGSGKTVFCRQLECLMEHKIFETKKDMFPRCNSLGCLGDKYEVVYFDAWMNDVYSDPMQSLLTALMMKFSTNKNYVEQHFEKILNILQLSGKSIAQQLGTQLVSKVTLKTINIDKITADISEENSKRDKIIDLVISVDKQRKEIHNLIDSICGDKKLLIIVDELDRCKPSFAVEFLELIKHFFDHEKTTFLISTNKTELSHTVKKYYGESFNGYGYLSRFFDMEINLPRISKKKYIESQFSNAFHSEPQIIDSINDVVNYFNLELRDIKRIAVPFQTISSIVLSHISEHNQSDALRGWEKVVIPFMVALKTCDGEKYNSFVNGNEEAIFVKFIMNSHDSYNYSDSKEKWEQLYKSIVSVYNESPLNDSTYLRVKEGIKIMFDSLSLIGESNEINPEVEV